MDFAVDFLEYVIQGLDNWQDNTDTYWERIVVWIMITYLELKTMLIEFVSPIAVSIIESVGISDALLSSWGGVSGDMMSVLAYLRIPESINLILSAFVTRFIMGLVA